MQSTHLTDAARFLTPKPYFEGIYFSKKLNDVYWKRRNYAGNRRNFI